jgi:peptide/nickel transport system permease protein
MARYVGGRLISGLLTLFLFVTLLFFLVNLVIPGDFVSQFILNAEDAQAFRESLGLDKPLWEQYWVWLRGLFSLDLGDSFGRGVPVTEALMASIPPTLLVLAVGLGLAFLLGGWLGRVTAYGDRSYFSGPVTFVAVVFLTAFPPVLGVVMEQGLQDVIGYTGLGAFGFDSDSWDWDAIFAGEAMGPSDMIWRMLADLATTFLVLVLVEWIYHMFTRRRVPRWAFMIAMVGIPLLVWSQMGISEPVWDVAASLSLLLTGVVILTFGDVLLVTRAAMDDVMLEDYVMVARAKGLPEKAVRDKHAARTAILPVLSRFTVSIPYFLTGLVILEAVFSGTGVAGIGALQRVQGPQGLGSLLFEAVADQDTPMIIGSLLVVGVLTLLLRIALDIVHAYLDPRIRFGNANGG